jgi:peptide/nickel transport system ATP-binding protein
MTTLTARGLTTRIPTTQDGRSAWVHAATDLDLDLDRGRVRALVGESGCGKSVLAATLIGLLPPGTRVTGSVRLGDTELVGAGTRSWQAVRGRRIGLVPQSPTTYLTPTRTVGAQLRETIRALRSNAGRSHAGRVAEPQGEAYRDRPLTAEDLMERVALDPSALHARSRETPR